ncbi:thioesterase family protein [Microbacterium karelineae]|uniref:thioesterase family protein n=1 Tax=Microbacterium karelineae TaxID=2654283 RepID=UPI0012EA773E|nr:thioesterase family protein [Microbacterium karelineae]
MEHTSYFERIGARELQPTPATSGAWNPAEVHIAPFIGLLLHEIERDAADRRGDDALVATRVAYDIYGAFPVAPLRVDTRVVRPGRTIELVEASLSQGDRTVLAARAWLQRAGDTAAIAGSHDARIPGPDTMPVASQEAWSGGFVQSIEVRRGEWQPGRGAFWAHSDLALVAGEEESDLAHAARLFDLANGMAPRAAPDEVLFPNIDLTLHVFRRPRRGWVGFDTSVAFGPDGHGLTSAILHDDEGSFGRVSQTLTVRPR